MRRSPPSPSLARILPALIHIQTHLDQDLSLDLLADEARLSKFHFHQLFRKTTGETPKACVDRLRLERAALHLLIRRAPVLEIALECGYRNPETFSRAFRARFAMSPRDYRRQWFRQDRDRAGRGRATVSAARYAQLSETRVVRLARILVAFIRHVGPYERVAPESFRRLTRWSRRRGNAGAAPLLLGIAHDAPGITPAERIRFDCCVQVGESFDGDGDIACQRTPGGEYAITEYIGSWDLKLAYSAILERLKTLHMVDVIGLPAIEIYKTTRIDPRHDLAQVSIAIPVKARVSARNSQLLR